MRFYFFRFRKLAENSVTAIPGLRSCVGLEVVVGGRCVGSEEGCTLVSTISGRVTSRLLIFTRIDELPNDVGVLQMLRTFKLDDNKLGTLTQDLTQDQLS